MPARRLHTSVLSWARVSGRSPGRPPRALDTPLGPSIIAVLLLLLLSMALLVDADRNEKARVSPAFGPLLSGSDAGGLRPASIIEEQAHRSNVSEKSWFTFQRVSDQAM